MANNFVQAAVFALLTGVLIVLILLLQRRVSRKTGGHTGPPALAVALTIMAAGFVVLAVGMFRESNLVTSLGIEVTGAGLTTVVLEWLLRPLQAEQRVVADTRAIRDDQAETLETLLVEVRQLRAVVEDIRQHVRQSPTGGDGG